MGDTNKTFLRSKLLALASLPAAFIVLLLALLLALAGCSDNGVGPKPPTDSDADNDGIKDSVDQCDADPEDKDGVEDSDGCPENIHPDKVTFHIVPSDSASGATLAATITVAGENTGEKGEQDYTLPYSEEAVEVCASLENYQTRCKDVVPDEDQDVLLKLPQEMVAITVTPKILGYSGWAGFSADYIKEHLWDVTFVVKLAGKTAKVEKEDVSLFGFEPPVLHIPAGSGRAKLSARIVYNLCAEIDTEGKARGCSKGLSFLDVSTGAKMVALDKDREIELELAHIKACQDNVDNDGDEKGDKADAGCVVNSSGDGYDPADDVEDLEGKTLTGYFNYSETTYVDGDNGPKKYLFWQNDFPLSLAHSVGKVNIFKDILYQSDKSEQNFSLKFKCGISENALNNINTSEVVYDKSNFDGWKSVKISVTPSFFHTGSFCQIYIKSEGKGRVIFGASGKQVATALSWRYEPEELE